MNAPNLPMSLIFITRNRRDELYKTLLSVTAQSHTDFELVVVDNGSSDMTPAMVREIYPEAVVVELNTNQGVGGGRNRGIEAATGDILVFLDDDASFASQDTLSRIRERFVNDPDLGILATNSYLAVTGEPEREAIPRRDKRISRTDYQTSYFCGVGFALRREVIIKTGLFFEPYIYSCEELDLSWRAIESGYRIIWAADIVVLHRRSPVERPQGRWVYTNAKNRLWLAVRHLPWRYVVSYGMVWWSYLLWVAVTHHLVRDYLRGARDSIDGLPTILKGRKVLSPTALAIIREKHGRLIY